VFFNALSGSAAYARMKRVDYKSGVIFALASVPGAVLGAIFTAFVPRGAFDLIFGALMILAGIYLWVTTTQPHALRQNPQLSHGLIANRSNLMVRSIVDREGIRYDYAFNPAIGITLSTFVGFLSSLLGVGGGFVHVPALAQLLHFPIHIATATSHFVLAIMALSGTLVHVANGVFVHGLRRTAVLGIGVLVGAQAGARLSNRVGGKWIIRGLALALFFVGVRLLLIEL